nr:hypothetical protein [Chloroflexota bacterium]
MADERTGLENRQEETEGTGETPGDAAVEKEPQVPSAIAIEAGDDRAPESEMPAAAESGEDPAPETQTDAPAAAESGDDTPAEAEVPGEADTPVEAFDAPESTADDAPESTAGEPASETVGPRTVGRFIADALRAAGVRYAFTVPGESFLGLLEGLQAAGIRVVATRHEGAAAFIAEAHGQLTGRPAAALGTRGVGAANLAIGIHTARQDSSPMFALVGQVERSIRGREAFQEIDQATTIGGLAAHAVELTAVADVPRMVGEAVRAALVGRPGPAFVSVPEDILDEELPEGTQLDTSRPAPIRPEPDDVRAVLHFLAAAERPVILAGGGILRARTSTDLVRLAELLRVPIVAGWRRGDVVSNDHPLFLGMAGYGSPGVVRDRLERADAVLVIGCRLSEITSFGYAIPANGQAWI